MTHSSLFSIYITLANCKEKQTIWPKFPILKNIQRNYVCCIHLVPNAWEIVKTCVKIDFFDDFRPFLAFSAFWTSSNHITEYSKDLKFWMHKALLRPSLKSERVIEWLKADVIGRCYSKFHHILNSFFNLYGSEF